MILSSSTWIALLLFPVFSILLFGVTIEIAMAQNKISFNLILSGIGLLLFNISLFLLLGKLEYSTNLQQKNIALQHEIDQNMKSTNALQAIFNEQRALTHDFNNHITTLYIFNLDIDCNLRFHITYKLVYFLLYSRTQQKNF